MKNISSEKENTETTAVNDSDIEKGVEIIDGKYVPLESFQSLQSKYYDLKATLEEREDLIKELEYWFYETDYTLFYIGDMIRKMKILKSEK